MYIMISFIHIILGKSTELLTVLVLLFQAISDNKCTEKTKLMSSAEICNFVKGLWDTHTHTQTYIQRERGWERNWIEKHFVPIKTSLGVVVVITWGSFFKMPKWFLIRIRVTLDDSDVCDFES